MTSKVMLIFGTRPEAIKMAPIIKELEVRGMDYVVVVTAQHREMLDEVLKVFHITPDYDLNIMRHDQSLSDITTRTLDGIDRLIKQIKPTIILVHGDTTTALAASLAAFYNQMPIGHIEAGLRTYQKYSPYPEEINRQLIGILADYHFAPTAACANHLIVEYKNPKKIYITGNTAIDALKYTVRKDYHHPILEKVQGKRLILVTAHRRENIAVHLEQIFHAVLHVVNQHPDVHAVYPVHLNPKVQIIANKILGHHPRIHLIDPLSVYDFHNMINHAHIILTDSGGIQEEAPTLGKPVLVLREYTERTEGIQAGTLKLAGVKKDDIIRETNTLLTNEDKYKEMANASNPYGDGTAAKQIVNILLEKIELN